MASLTKTRYPNKTRLNLMMREPSIYRPGQLALGLVAIVLVTAAFGKFAVWDLLASARRAETAVSNTHKQIALLQTHNADYEVVALEYSRFFPIELDGAGDVPVDCIQVLALLESKLVPYASIPSAAYANNSLVVQLNGITLDTASGIVDDLYQSPLVSEISLSTADTQEGQPHSATVNMSIALTTGEGGEAP